MGHHLLQKCRVVALSTLLAMLIFSGSLQASQTEAGSLLQQQQGVPELPEELPVQQHKSPVPELVSGSGDIILIKEIRFRDDQKQILESELKELVSDAIGRQLDFDGIQVLVDRVTDHFKRAGWLLTRAYLPRQDVTDGVLEIAILIGRVSEQNPFEVNEGKSTLKRTSTEYLLGIAEKNVPAGEPLHKDQLERSILLLNDLSGISAQSSMVPGDKTGETRVRLTVDEDRLFSGSSWVDNYGSHNTGNNQLSVQLRVDNPRGLGDQGTLLAVHNKGSDTLQLGYSMPLGEEGLRLNLNHSNMRYSVITEAGKAAGLKGTAVTDSLSLKYPVVRSKKRNYYLSASYLDQNLVDDSASGRLKDKSKRSTSITFSGDQLGQGGSALTGWNAGFSIGDLDLSALSSDLSSDASSYKTHGSFSKFTYGVNHLQRLSDQYTLLLKMNGQIAHKNLDSSENLILGGSNGVRAYSGSEASGDSGHRINLELRYNWPEMTRLGKLQLSAFYDWGQIQLHKDPYEIAITTATGKNLYSISGTGVGLTLTQQQSYMLRAAWATKIGNNPGRDSSNLDADGTDDQSRFWVQSMLWF